METREKAALYGPGTLLAKTAIQALVSLESRLLERLAVLFRQ